MHLLTHLPLRVRVDEIGQISKCVLRRLCMFPGCINLHQVNSLVFARVSLAHKDMEPELECFDAQTRKAEGYGEVKGGFLVRCSLKMSRK